MKKNKLILILIYSILTLFNVCIIVAGSLIFGATSLIILTSLYYSKWLPIDILMNSLVFSGLGGIISSKICDKINLKILNDLND